MSNLSKVADHSALPAELTPKQLAMLPFVPGNLECFDEKEKLPPTARPQWTYVQLNPSEYLDRFTREVGLPGVKTAIFFINKELYEDQEKDLRTPITVHLITNPEQFEDIKAHLEHKRLSHQVIADNSGFALPYLGSIQKALDTLALESLVNYVFIKNSITRESYYIWVSVPISYLQVELVTEAKVGHVEKTEAQSVKEAALAEVKKEETRSVPQPPPSSQARQGKAEKENFNYIAYNDTGETVPPIIPHPVKEKIQTVIVSVNPPPKKESPFNRLAAGFQSKKGEEKTPAKSRGKAPSAIFDSLQFLSLGTFNFYCSILLLQFLGAAVEGIGAIMVEAVTLAALLALLFTMVVIRPSFRNQGSRFWALGAYVSFAGVAGFRVLQSFDFPETSSYLVSTAVAVVALISALVFAFLRIDRHTTRGRIAEEVQKEVVQEETTLADNPGEVSTASTTVSPATQFPAPVKPPKKEEKARKIALPTSSGTEKKAADSAMPALSSSSAVSPISEEQKEIIRNRLTRRDKPPPSAHDDRQMANETIKSSGKTLASEELRERLASKLQQARSLNEQATAMGSGNQQTTLPAKKLQHPKSRRLTKPGKAGYQPDSSESESEAQSKSIKLSLPKSR